MALVPTDPPPLPQPGELPHIMRAAQAIHHALQHVARTQGAGGSSRIPRTRGGGADGIAAVAAVVTAGGCDLKEACGCDSAGGEGRRPPPDRSCAAVLPPRRRWAAVLPIESSAGAAETAPSTPAGGACAASCRASRSAVSFAFSRSNSCSPHGEHAAHVAAAGLRAAKQQAHDLRGKHAFVQQPLGLAQTLQVERVHLPDSLLHSLHHPFPCSAVNTNHGRTHNYMVQTHVPFNHTLQHVKQFQAELLLYRRAGKGRDSAVRDS
jgi:hypothetical protein